MPVCRTNGERCEEKESERKRKRMREREREGERTAMKVVATGVNPGGMGHDWVSKVKLAAVLRLNLGLIPLVT